MLRKLPATGGRRGARAVPIVTLGLWYQVLLICDERYVAFDAALPKLKHIIGTAAAIAGVDYYALTTDKVSGKHLPIGSTLT